MVDRKDLYRNCVVAVCKNLDLDLKLLMAIISVESAWNPNAVRYEPSFGLTNNPKYFAKLNGITETTERTLQHFSFGLGQIMGATSRDCGYKGALQALCIPETGVLWAAMYLKRLTVRYSSILDQIAAYNAGEPKKRDDGTYINQDYVDKVLRLVQVQN